MRRILFLSGWLVCLPAGAVVAADPATPAGNTPPAAEAGKAEKQPEAEQAVKQTTVEDLPEPLREVVQQWQSRKYRQAAVGFSKLINSSSPEQLQKLSKEAEAATEKSLAELAADAHIEAAREKTKGGAIRLEYVTAYENEPLVRRLKELFEAALDEPILPPEPKVRLGGRPSRAGTRNDKEEANEKGDDKEDGDRNEKAEHKDRRGEGRTSGSEGRTGPARRRGPALSETPMPGPLRINDNLDDPRMFDGGNATSEQYAAFLRHISYAESLLNERLRFDASLRTDKKAKADLTEKKKALENLQKEVQTVSRLSPPQRERRSMMIRAEQDARRRQQEMSTNRPPPGDRRPRPPRGRP